MKAVRVHSRSSQNQWAPFCSSVSRTSVCRCALVVFAAALISGNLDVGCFIALLPSVAPLAKTARSMRNINTLHGVSDAASALAAGSQPDNKALLCAVRDGVAAMGGSSVWEDAAQVIAAGLSSEYEEAEFILAKAFGWTGWYELNRPSYLKPKLPPDSSKLRESFRWLIEGPLRLSLEELKIALATKPLVYLQDPAASYAAAIQAAPEQFQSPEAFRNLLVTQPQILDLTHNCELTDPSERPVDAWGQAVHCDGRCTNCWRTATPRLLGKVLDGVEV